MYMYIHIEGEVEDLGRGVWSGFGTYETVKRAFRLPAPPPCLLTEGESGMRKPGSAGRLRRDGGRPLRRGGPSHCLGQPPGKRS